MSCTSPSVPSMRAWSSSSSILSSIKYFILPSVQPIKPCSFKKVPYQNSKLLLASSFLCGQWSIEAKINLLQIRSPYKDFFRENFGNIINPNKQLSGHLREINGGYKTTSSISKMNRKLVGQGITKERGGGGGGVVSSYTKILVLVLELCVRRVRNRLTILLKPAFDGGYGILVLIITLKCMWP